MDRAEARMDRAETRMDRAEARMNRAEARMEKMEKLHDRRMAAISKLLRQGMKSIADLAEAQKATERTLRAFIQSSRNGGNGHSRH
jgi:hypothetical protein